MRPRFARKRDNVVVPSGGVDMVTAPMLQETGVAVNIENFECGLEDGYARIAGYDTYIDGPTPAEEDPYVAAVNTSPVLYLVANEELFGETSGATMRFLVAADPASTTGLYTGAPLGARANQGIYAADVKGAFALGERLLRVGAPPTEAYVGTLAAVPRAVVGGTPEETETLREDARDAIRATMRPPTQTGIGNTPIGGGDVIGLFVYLGKTYVLMAIREIVRANTAGAPSFPYVHMYRSADRSTPSTRDKNRGWELVANFPIHPVLGFKFDYVIHNFVGDGGADKVYFATGVAPAYEFDGSSFVQVTTGMADDTPDLIAVHKYALWLSFGPSLQFSAPNDPFLWNVTLGAGEFVVDSDITGIQSLTSQDGTSNLLVSTKNTINMVYGNSQNDFGLFPYIPDMGAIDNTLQVMGHRVVVHNNFGLSTLSTAQEYGGFTEATFSGAIKPFLDERRNKVTASVVVRGKNQYRLFFDDGTGVYVTFDGQKLKGITLVRFPDVVRKALSVIQDDGSELVLIGCDSGRVNRLDVGSSFAGKPIQFFCAMSFNHFKSSSLLKHFKRVEIEVQPEGFFKMDVGYDLDQRGPRRAVTDNQETVSPSSELTAFWDTFQWDAFHWDGASVSPVVVDTPGSGKSLSIRFQGRNRISRRFNISSITAHYTVRRFTRGG